MKYVIAIFIPRWELESLKYVYDLTNSGENLIGKNGWEWQRDHKRLGRIRIQICFTTTSFSILQIFVSHPLDNQVLYFFFFFNYLCEFYLEKEKKSPASTQRLCHPIYQSGFCLWEVACFLNLFLIFLKTERWPHHVANRPQQNCATGTCLLFVQPAAAFPRYCIVYIALAGWNFW